MLIGVPSPGAPPFDQGGVPSFVALLQQNQPAISPPESCGSDPGHPMHACTPPHPPLVACAWVSLAEYCTGVAPPDASLGVLAGSAGCRQHAVPEWQLPGKPLVLSQQRVPSGPTVQGHTGVPTHRHTTSHPGQQSKINENAAVSTKIRVALAETRLG